MRRFLSIFILYFFPLTLFAQRTISGRIIDVDTDEPLFGVAVICNNVPVAFSDNEGRFDLPLDDLQPKDTILFRHLSYHVKSVVVSHLHSDTIVRLENRFFSLSEVSITAINYKKIIKDITAKYKQLALTQQYWTKVHQTQTLTCKGNFAGYVEYTGYMLCMGNELGYPFIQNQWIPEHIRRTKEDSIVSQILGRQYRNRFSEYFICNTWMVYRFFDVAHPLGKYHNYYTIKVDSSFSTGGKDYWAVSFRQTKRIVIKNRVLTNINGQICIEKETNTPTSLTGSCDQSNLFAAQINLEYGIFDNKILPRDMTISVVQNKDFKGKELIHYKIMYENRISFSEAAIRKKGKFTEILSEWIVPDFLYEPEYWQSFPMKDSMDFSESAEIPIMQPIPPHQYFRNWAQINYQQAKIEIEQLLWKRIQPAQ